MGKRGPVEGHSNKYNIPALHAEYLSGDIETVQALLRFKGIPAWTGAKWTAGWTEERQAFQRGVAAKAIQKVGEKRAKLLAKNIEAGELLLDRGTKALTAKTSEGEYKLQLESAEQSARTVKMGAEVLARVVELEGGASGDPEAPLAGVSLEIEQNVRKRDSVEGLDQKSLKIVAKAIGRSKAGMP